MPDANRIAHITKLQSLAVTLVVLGHSSPLQSAAANPGFIVWYRGLIYCFHMPLFFFISGYLFAYGCRRAQPSYWSMMASKAVRLLLPYLVLSTVAFFVKNGLPQFSYRSVSLDWASYVGGLVYPSSNPIVYFWFLPTLFVVFSISPPVRFAVLSANKWMHLAVLAAALGLYIVQPFELKVMNAGKIDQHLIHFCLGAFACVYGRRVDSVLKRPIVLPLLALLLVLAFELARMGNDPWVSLLVSCSGIACCYCLSFLLATWKWTPAFIDGHYYQVYLLCWFFQIPVRIAFQAGLFAFWAAALGMFVLGLMAPIAVVKFMPRQFSPLAPVLGLRRFPG